jgi:myo-inositol catabolism protein IolS
VQTDYIDLYQVHWPANCGLLGLSAPAERAAVAAAVRALEAAKAVGQIRHYGVCNFGTEDLAGFAAAGGASTSNQLPYNLLWRSIEDGILPATHAAGQAVLTYSSLQQGLLAADITDPGQLSIGRLRTRMFAPTRSPLSQHGSPGLEAQLFGPAGALAALRAAAAAGRVSLAELAVS